MSSLPNPPPLERALGPPEASEARQERGGVLGDLFPPRILIEFISAASQRYPTLGDWQFTTLAGVPFLRIKASGPDPQSQLAIAIHELVEAFLCHEHGITEESVDEFDLAFNEPGEPGDDVRAPYHREHRSATAVERSVVDALGLRWRAYERALTAFEEKHGG